MRQTIAALPAALGLALCLTASSEAAGTLNATGASDGVPAVAQEGGKAEQVSSILSKIKLPPGFRISLYALAPDARHMAIAPGGSVVFLGTDKKTFYALTDGGDGRASQVKPFASNLDLALPNGPCFGPDGTLYLAEQNRVLAFPAAEKTYRNAQVKAMPVVPRYSLIPRSEESGGHSARVCRVGPDGKLYIALGQPYNVPPAGKLDTYRKWGMGGIIRMGTDGSGREVYADGLRNSVGLDFNPKDGTLWFTDNQVDGMGDDIPPGELNRATRAGQNFGFPWYGGGRVRTKEFKDKTPPANLVFPQVEMEAHAADLGMTFYTGSAFPAKYRGAIFSAQHGSWNRTQPIGARVMVTFLKPDGTADHSEVFASGWLTKDGSYLGRPVDVAQMADGSLLVSDDYAGAVYRITYEGS